MAWQPAARGKDSILRTQSARHRVDHGTIWDEVALTQHTLSRYTPVLIAPFCQIRRAGVSGIFLHGVVMQPPLERDYFLTGGNGDGVGQLSTR